MKTFTLSALSALCAGLTGAMPLDMIKRNNNGGNSAGFSQSDITILQFALTLEHLENTFYQDAFRVFKQEDFLAAGFDERFFANLEFIAADESAHVQFLEAAIQSAGVAPVQPCTYNFPVTDVASFVTVSAVLESIGTSAYLGAAPFVNSKQILSVAASIMATEGLHTSLQRSSLGAIGAPNPFQTPLDPNSVFTLASAFIVSCPSSNPPLPFTAFPSLAVQGQQCLDEASQSGNVDGFSTNNVNYSTLVQNLENSNSTATTIVNAAASTTTSVTTTTNASNTTTTTAASSTTDATASSTTTAATATAAPTKRAAALEARTFSSSCAAPAAGGSSMQLVPDFSKSKGFDFKSVHTIFVTILSGLDVISIEASFSGDGSITVVVPPSVGGGQVFVFITTVDISGKSLSDSQVLFGPAVMELAPSFPSIIQ